MILERIIPVLSDYVAPTTGLGVVYLKADYLVSNPIQSGFLILVVLLIGNYFWRQSDTGAQKREPDKE